MGHCGYLIGGLIWVANDVAHRYRGSNSYTQADNSKVVPTDTSALTGYLAIGEILTVSSEEHRLR